MEIDPGISLSEDSSKVSETIVVNNQNSLASDGTMMSANIRFSTLAEFQRAVPPKVYNAFIMSFAYSICRDMQDGNDRIIEEQRKMNDYS